MDARVEKELGGGSFVSRKKAERRPPCNLIPKYAEKSRTLEEGCIRIIRLSAPFF